MYAADGSPGPSSASLCQVPVCPAELCCNASRSCPSSGTRALPGKADRTKKSGAVLLLSYWSRYCLNVRALPTTQLFEISSFAMGQTHSPGNRKQILFPPLSLNVCVCKITNLPRHYKLLKSIASKAKFESKDDSQITFLVY